MARYTLEIGEISKFQNIFSFEYDFYTDDKLVRQNFEKKFIQKFRYNEIGAETIGRFKNILQATLNEIMPYYTQLYQTELEAKGVQFLLNKDLKETFSRNLDIDNSSNQASENNNSSNSDSLTNTDYISKTSDTPQNDIGNLDKYLTSANIDKTKDSNNSSSSDTSKGSMKTDGKAKHRETTELISQGNIGTTSSAELLEKWREVLLNIDQLIYKELSCCMLKVY